MRRLEHCNIVKLKYFFYSSGDKVSGRDFFPLLFRLLLALYSSNRAFLMQCGDRLSWATTWRTWAICCRKDSRRPITKNDAINLLSCNGKALMVTFLFLHNHTTTTTTTPNNSNHPSTDRNAKPLGAKSKCNCVIPFFGECARARALSPHFTVWLQSIRHGCLVGLATSTGSPQFRRTHTYTDTT